MGKPPNTLRWDRTPGHYEVYYLSLTDPSSGVGVWIRFTMLAPLDGSEPTCALWFLASGPPGGDAPIARKQTLPISEMTSTSAPFSIQIGQSRLDDRGVSGAFEDVRFELSWTPRLERYSHVHPLLARAGLAKTQLELPHADLSISGEIVFADRTLTLESARGGQAHLWGSKHATRWAWMHTNDLRTPTGERIQDSFIDAVSVFVERFGRQIGPNTPVLARLQGHDFTSITPRRVLANSSRFGLAGWDLQAQDSRLRLMLRINAPRERMIGVAYTDPDGERAYCYNTEVASLTGSLARRDGSGWRQISQFQAPGLTHFEYAQRERLADIPLLLD
jgi:hypothetical protein